MRRHVLSVVWAVLIAWIPSVAAADSDLEANEKSLLTDVELQGGALAPEAAPGFTAKLIGDLAPSR